MYLALRIIEKILIIYFTIYFVIDILLYFYSVITFFFRKQENDENFDFQNHSVSIIVPAYNEAVSIVTCTNMLAELDYPNFEIIVVNDGSKDQTMQVLKKNYELIETKKKETDLLKTQEVMHSYIAGGKNILILDKKNGGKADAINAGINYATGNYICTIDADSVLDQQALKSVIKPFIKNKNTIVTGGQLAVANDVRLQNNKVINSKVPQNIWVQWQIIEYIKSFLISRIALSKIDALLIMSGAFSLFKKEDLLQIGGFLSKKNTHFYIEKHIGLGKQTVCEDMEVVVRLWKFKHDKNEKAKAKFLPEPICWTEVPDNPNSLYKQRSRWHQGLGETLKMHKDMIFEPKYGVTGLAGLPYYLFFEFLSPVVKLFSIVFIIVAARYGVLNPVWITLLLISVMLTTAIITSSITAIIEYWSKKNAQANRDALRYKTFWDWIWLIFTGILAEFSYSFFKIAAQITGIINFVSRKHDWKKFDRKGIENI
ncbi:MAG TPA: glycosyltransferase family 2 protein [Bacteroidales bacterium]|nr:glycosyltransferase family 2 protein [Bacteroidales bacterium]HIP48852.1 glycosyltransferase family 2 protein [Lutibacter sp.]